MQDSTYDQHTNARHVRVSLHDGPLGKEPRVGKIEIRRVHLGGLDRFKCAETSLGSQLFIWIADVLFIRKRQLQLCVHFALLAFAF